MALLRLLSVSIVAAVSACIVASLVLYGSVEQGAFIPLLLALPGSLLLAAAYAALRQGGTPIAMRYLLLLILGVAAGALMLGSISSGDAEGALVGGLYGLATAGCWAALHVLSKRAFVSGP